MANNVKYVTLRDPKTNDILVPRIAGTLSYETVDDKPVAPFVSDADTLQGHPADYFATAASMQECFQSVSEGKALIAAAVTDKGVETAADATFATMAANIGSIATGNTLLINKMVSSVESNGYIGKIAVPSDVNADDVLYYAAYGTFNNSYKYCLMYDGNANTGLATIVAYSTTASGEKYSSINAVKGYTNLVVDTANGSGLIKINSIVIEASIIVLK